MRKTITYAFLILAVLLTACRANPPAPAAQATTAPTIAPTQPPAPTATTAPIAPTEPAVEATATEAVESDALAGTDWEWVYFNSPLQKVSVDTPENYTLSFKPAGLVEIKADCNQASGTYEVTGDQLKITLGPMTLAACPPESLSDDYLKYLGITDTYAIDNENLFINLAADAGTMEFTPAGSDQAAIVARAAQADPIAGILNLGGGEGRWLDPAMISVLGGTSGGRTVDVSRLAPECAGYLPTRPDVVVRWTPQEGLDTLRFFFLSMGDPSLVVVTPGGEVLCNDNLNPLVPDPYIEVENPEEGRYLAFLGTNRPEVNYPGFLVVTARDLNPATLDLGRLFPRRVNPEGVPQPVEITVLKIDAPPAAQPQGGTLSGAQLPYEQQLTGGGDIRAFDLEQPNDVCTGFISAEPNFRFEWTGDTSEIAMYFESMVDSTLFVRDPDGNFLCADDLRGKLNANPYLTLQPKQGTYNVWVGSAARVLPAEGTLTITNDLNARPASPASNGQ